MNAPARPAFRVLGFCGSLRRASSNRRLLGAAAALAPTGLEVEIADWASTLPSYNADLLERLPPVVDRWQQAVVAADALVLAIPEYNHGPSGHAKDAIDWVSRPYGRHQLRDKAIAVMSSGESGGGRHMQAWLVPILASLGNTMVVEPTIAVVNGSDRIATDGPLDAELADLVGMQMQALLDTLAARG